jgi:hypothetical protein
MDEAIHPFHFFRRDSLGEGSVIVSPRIKWSRKGSRGIEPFHFPGDPTGAVLRIEEGNRCDAGAALDDGIPTALPVQSYRTHYSDSGDHNTVASIT